MSKAFVELRYRKKVYKLRANDIAKLYKVSKRHAPCIPAFEEGNKTNIDTDCDSSLAEEIRS